MNGVQSKLKGKDLDFLFEAILKLEDINECYNFFEDICTISELKALAQRLHVAKMLREKKHILKLQRKLKLQQLL